MNIILPIMITAIIIGVTTKKMTPIHWAVMSIVIILVIAKNFNH